MTELKNYLQRMSEIRRSGSAVKETSFYGTLETLLNEVGKSLKPSENKLPRSSTPNRQ